MGKKLAVVGSDNLYHIGAKAYMTVDGVHKSVKKMYLTQNGVHRLVFGGGGADVGSMVITYSADGGMTDAGIVTMGDGKQYRLLTLTKSGTLTVPEEVQAEVWMCGGGVNGGNAENSGAYGGAGAYTATGAMTLAKNTVAVVGAGGNGLSSFGPIQTSACSGQNGGTGGGGAQGSAAGLGDGVDKHPFSDAEYFPDAHCGGGGGGGANSAAMGIAHIGGNGGTNGGNGAGSASAGGSNYGGTGGAVGGGMGGAGQPVSANGGAATFYGSGGGGGGFFTNGVLLTNGTGGAGYQGVIYVRFPVDQA